MFKVKYKNGNTWTDISEYIHFDSLKDFEQIAEGEGMWVFRVDNIDLDIDISFLDSLNLAKNNIQGLINKQVQVYYYGKLVFNGLIQEVNYDYFDEDLKLGLDSYAKIISNLSVNYFYTSHYAYGDELDWVIWMLTAKIRTAMKKQNYEYVEITRNIDVQDYEFMRSVRIETELFPSPKTLPTFYGGTGLYSFEGVYSYNNNYYYSWRNSTLSPQIWVQKLKSDGTLSAVEACPTDFLGDRIIPMEFGDDKGLEALIKHRLGRTTLNYKCQIKLSDIFYFAIINGLILRIYIDTVDKFIYEYGKEIKIGQILKDFAVVTNSIVHIDSNLCINYQSRDGRTGLSAKTPVSMEYETETKVGEKLELPVEIILLDQVREDIINYYDEYLNGNFYKYKTQYDREDFTDAEFPLMLKEVKRVENSLGIVKKVKYMEDLIEIESERRL
ncbi:MAG: hypothetical protein K8R79_07035 [Calditrichales bacterium]|nr:hypothetical protein [Calditrichales bacterium]